MDAVPVNSKTNHTKFQQTAWVLSLAGFIPFGFLAIAMLFFKAEEFWFQFFANAMKTYGAVILSFLGGIRWGTTLRSSNVANSHRQLIISVIPSLFGWFALLLPVPFVFAVLAMAFAGQGAWDALAAEKGMFGQWFIKIRIVLTLLVTMAMIVAFFASI